MDKKPKSLRKKTWQEFIDAGLLWWINSILHVFGWAIVVTFENGDVTDVYPARTSYRGFSRKCNDEGFIKISKFIEENAKDFCKDVHLK